MKSHSLLCLLLLSWGLLSCDKKATHPSATAPKPEKRVESIPLKFQSEEVLPGSKEVYSSPIWENDIPLSIAHETPSMDKKARGVYSYLGSARVFKSICGFDIPEWVEPIKGDFSVSLRRSGAVRLSTVEYKIDPARRAELEKLITEANAREFPQRTPVIFYPSTSQVGARVGYISFKPDGKVKESMAARLEEDGTVVLMASQGPVGWDD